MSSGFLVGGGRLTPARLTASLLACAAICGVVVLLAPLVGSGEVGKPLSLLPPSAIWDDGPDGQILWTWRMPRILAALVCGAALSAAGCAFQAVLRNPLAEPFTLGVSSGASLAAVIAIRVGLEGVMGTTGTAGAAIVGAFLAVAVVWQLGRVGEALPPATLVLAGVTVSMFCAAVSMVVQYTADFTEVGRMLRWMMGGLEWTRYGTVARATPPIALAAAVLLWHARGLNALAAGSEAAASVGVDAGRTSTLVFAAASLLVGASIAVAGPIGFVGLIVPHSLRALCGPDHRVLLPASMMCGGALLVVCDTLARVLGQMPVGVMTALLGGPFFLVLLVRGKRGAGLWSGG